jgi:phosphatidylglycerol:prolipoprotein diacylglycerol transferase
MYAIIFPAIDPVLIEIGPFALRWYGLAYATGLFAGLYYIRWMVGHAPALMSKLQVDDFLLWVLAGVVLGGRLGYVLFYKPNFYLSNPIEILKITEGGMSFHGGLLGVIAAILLFARAKKIDKWYIGDNIACAVPLGIGLGRLANFINGELWGRVAQELPWAMVFPGAGPLPRHPSQLYQAGLEGLALFIVMHLLWRNTAIRERAGTLAGCFLIGYGVFRSVAEFFREPDSFIGLMAGGTTMGQWLSLPMILFGIYFIWRAKPSNRTT